MGQSTNPASSLLFRHADADRPARVMVIAEIGVNHDGDADRAASLIHAAAGAGADAVKFQLFRPDRLLSRDAVLAKYQNGKAADAVSLLERLTLSLEAMRRLRGEAAAVGLGFVVTPFSLGDVDDLASLDVDVVKIASPDAVNTPLLSAAASLGKPMIVSTGTCLPEELNTAAGHAQHTGGALLQCVSSYPTPDHDAALGGIAALRQQYPRLSVGYSDHTASLDTGGLAVAAGACVLEKHLTHDRNAAGPDHAASVEPAGLQNYVQSARRAAAMLGPIAKSCHTIERDVLGVSRQSVCTVRDLPAGHVLTREDLTLKRPGIGIPAAELDATVGQTLAEAVKANHVIRASQLQRP